MFENAPYCKRHYHQLNNSLCRTCDDPIEGPCAQTIEGWRFHPECFRCNVCLSFQSHHGIHTNTIDRYADVPLPMFTTCLNAVSIVKLIFASFKDNVILEPRKEEPNLVVSSNNNIPFYPFTTLCFHNTQFLFYIISCSLTCCESCYDCYKSGTFPLMVYIATTLFKHLLQIGKSHSLRL